MLATSECVCRNHLQFACRADDNVVKSRNVFKRAVIDCLDVVAKGDGFKSRAVFKRAGCDCGCVSDLQIEFGDILRSCGAVVGVVVFFFGKVESLFAGIADVFVDNLAHDDKFLAAVDCGVVVFKMRPVEHVLAHRRDVVVDGRENGCEICAVRKRLLADCRQIARRRKIDFGESFKVHARFCADFADGAHDSVNLQCRRDDDFVQRIVRNLVDAHAAVRLDRDAVLEHHVDVVSAESFKFELSVVRVVEHPLDVCNVIHKSVLVCNNRVHICGHGALIISESAAVHNVVRAALDEIGSHFVKSEIHALCGGAVVLSCLNFDLCDVFAEIVSVCKPRERNSVEFSVFNAKASGCAHNGESCFCRRLVAVDFHLFAAHRHN